MSRSITIPILICIALISIFAIASIKMSIVAVFIPVVVITFVIYLKTSYHQIPDSDKILPLYLIALSVQFLHFLEEYLTDFVTVIPALFNQQPYSIDFWIGFNMTAYTIFALGGIVLLKGYKELMIIPLFFILAGVVFNSIAHIGLSIYAGGYFSGLYTALIYAVLGPILLMIIFETRRSNLSDQNQF